MDDDDTAAHTEDVEPRQSNTDALERALVDMLERHRNLFLTPGQVARIARTAGGVERHAAAIARR